MPCLSCLLVLPVLPVLPAHIRTRRRTTLQRGSHIGPKTGRSAARSHCEAISLKESKGLPVPTTSSHIISYNTKNNSHWSCINLVCGVNCSASVERLGILRGPRKQSESCFRWIRNFADPYHKNVERGHWHRHSYFSGIANIHNQFISNKNYAPLRPRTAKA